jgi:hypothetical protein
MFPNFMQQLGQFGSPANAGLLGLGVNMLDSGLQGQSTGQGLAAGLGGGLGGYLGGRQLQQAEEQQQEQQSQQEQLMKLLLGGALKPLGAAAGAALPPGFPNFIGAAGGGVRPY